MPENMGQWKPPFNADEDVKNMSLVEIAERLDKVTAWMEAERVEEREARKAYEVVAERTRARIQEIKDYASDLISEQQRRMSNFSGMLGRQGAAAPLAAVAETKPAQTPRRSSTDDNGKPRTIEDAIMAIWELADYDEPLTTDEIAEALPEVGYESKAAWKSLKSTVNQALAKLCKAGEMDKFRIDGTPVPDDGKARARRYMPAR